MAYRNLQLAAVLATGMTALTGIPEPSRADIIAVNSGIAVQESDVAAPARGMTMDQVSAKFGAPLTKLPTIGQPPITRWDYPGFVVYFERNHVIHSVIANS